MAVNDPIVDPLQITALFRKGGNASFPKQRAIHKELYLHFPIVLT